METKALTGDDLGYSKTYSVKDSKGELFYLGKLMNRDRFFSPFHGTYSNYNNIFDFENKPPVHVVLSETHNKPVYYETPPPTNGGKKKTRRNRKGKKIKKSKSRNNRRKSNRRR